MFLGGLLAGVPVLAVVAIAALGVPWQAGIAAGFAVFVLLAATLRRKFKRTLKNEDIAFWLISQRILPPIAVVLPLYVLFNQFGLLDTQASLKKRRALRTPSSPTTSPSRPTPKTFPAAPKSAIANARCASLC